MYSQKLQDFLKSQLPSLDTISVEKLQLFCERRNYSWDETQASSLEIDWIWEIKDSLITYFARPDAEEVAWIHRDSVQLLFELHDTFLLTRSVQPPEEIIERCAAGRPVYMFASEAPKYARPTIFNDFPFSDKGWGFVIIQELAAILNLLPHQVVEESERLEVNVSVSNHGLVNDKISIVRTDKIEYLYPYQLIHLLRTDPDVIIYVTAGWEKDLMNALRRESTDGY